MSSFFADTLAVIAHQPETVFAFLSVSRPIMNSSVVPVALSRDAIWDSLVSKPELKSKEENYYKLFFTFSDTMQFAEKLRFHSRSDEGTTFLNEMFTNLVENKRYFTSTLQHIDFSSVAAVPLFCAKGMFRNVRSIGLQFCKSELEDDDLKWICDRLSSLEKLDLRSQINITDEGFSCLSSLKGLRNLSLHETSVTSLSFLKDLKRLETLTLNFCEDLTDESFDFGDDEPVLLALIDVSLEYTSQFVNAALHQLQFHAPNLRSLTCTSVSKEGCTAIAEMKCLRKLVMVDSSWYLDDSEDNNNDNDQEENLFNNIMSSLSCLEEITVDDFSDSNLRSVAESASPVRVMKLSCVISDNAFSHFLTTAKHLESFSMEYNNVFTGDIGEDKSFSSSKTLKSLAVSNCPKLNDVGVKALLRGVSSTLKIFEICWCPKISSEGLFDAFKTSNCKESLEELNVTGCSGLLDLRFLNGLKSLNKLNVSYTKFNFFLMTAARVGFTLLPPTLEILILSAMQVDDVELARIPEAVLTNLKFLDVFACNKLTNKGLVETIPKMINLETLDIASYSESKFTLDKEGIETVVEKLHYLKTLILHEDLVADVASSKSEFAKKFGHLVIERPDN